VVPRAAALVRPCTYLQVVQDYAYETFGPALGQGWVKDAEAYLLMLRMVVDLQQASSRAMGGDEQSAEGERQAALQLALRKWVLETGDAGAVPTLSCMDLWYLDCAEARSLLIRSSQMHASGQSARSDRPAAPWPALHKWVLETSSACGVVCQGAVRC
jgi:hypothetical protein